MSARRIETRYGSLELLSTDAVQLPWLEVSGAAVDDACIDAVYDVLSERPRGAMIDVGACYGVWSVALRDCVNFVTAFEPQQKIFDLLKKNLETHLFGRHNALHMAAWSHQREMRLPLPDYTKEDNFGGVGFGDTRPDFEMVEVCALDALSFTPVSFIKIDAEGSEYEIVTGAKRLLSRDRPVMFVEYEHEDTSERGLRVLLESLSYELVKFPGNWLCLPLGG